MSTLYIMGADALAYFSKSAFVTTTDLQTFDALPVPFGVHSVPITAAHTGGVWCAASSAGEAAWSTDVTGAWNAYDLQQRSQQFTQVISHNNQFVAVGMSRNSQLQEQATVWLSENAYDHSWVASYNYLGTHSWLMNTCVIDSDSLVAVGHTQRQPLLITSSNQGQTWNQEITPSNWPGAVTACAYRASDNRIWVAGTGWMATSMYDPGNWSWSVFGVNMGVIRGIMVDNDHIMCWGGSHWAVSTNGFDFDVYEIASHSIQSAVIWQNQLLLGTHSLLTQQNLFVVDMMTRSITGINCGVHAHVMWHV